MELGNNTGVFCRHGDAVSRDKTPACYGMCDERACFLNLYMYVKVIQKGRGGGEVGVGEAFSLHIS